MQTPSRSPIVRFLNSCRAGLLMLAVMALVQPARAALLTYEGYNYPTNSDVGGQSGGLGWTGNWAVTPGDTNTAPGFEYIDALGNILIVEGNKGFFTGIGGNSTGQRDLPYTRGGAGSNSTTWISLIIFRGGPPSVNHPTNIYPRGANLSFFNAGTEIWGVGNPTAAPTNNLGLMRGADLLALRPSTNPAVPFDQVNFAVVRVDHIDGAFDNAYFWVNPILSGEPDTNNASSRSVGEYEYGPFNRVRPFAGNNNTPAGGAFRPYAEITIDEIRIGTTFDDVAPFIPGQGKSVLWEGGVNGDWDKVTDNWLTNGGPATTFANGDAVTIDDTGISTNINVTGILFPSSITVSNNTKNYLLQGTGPIAGIYGIQKFGTGKLTIAIPDISTGPIGINQGTLQIGNGGTVGDLGGGVVANNGSLIFDLNTDYGINNLITGGGSVTKNGTGAIVYGAANAYAGGTIVNSGSLFLHNFLLGGGSMSAASGTTLGGHGTNTGPTTVSGVLAPGQSPGLNVAGTFGAGGLTLASGATVSFEVNTNNTIGGRTNDLIQVNGNLTLNGNTLNVALLNPTVTTAVTYRVVNYTGTKSGSFGTLNLPGVRYAGVLSEAANQINLTFSGSGPSSLLWNSFVNNTWDLTGTSNWNNLTTALNPDLFYNFDTVAFDDSASLTEVSIAGTVRPMNMTVDNTTDNYVFTGSGKITGTGRLTKTGSGQLLLDEAGVSDYSGGVAVSNGVVIFARSNAISGGIIIASNTVVQVGTNGGSGSLPSGASVMDGTLIFNTGGDVTASAVLAGSESGLLIKTNGGILTLSGANTFTGAVSVVGGTLRTANASALGRTNLGTTLSAGTTLDVNGVSLGFEPITTEGAGVGGQGAIVNNSTTAQINALRTVTLLGDSTFGGIGRWDIRESIGGSVNATLSGGSFTLRKIGTNIVSLVGVNATIGDIIVEQGQFGIELGTLLTGGNITVSNGAGIRFFNPGVIQTRPIALNGNGTGISAEIASGTVQQNAAVTVNGDVVFGGTGTSFNVNSGISGTANLLKLGSSRLTFNSAASYAGSTVVSNGTLVIDGGKTGGTGITVHAGGVLAGGGASSISGEDVVVNGGISPGNPGNIAQETLTIAQNLTMNSTTNLFELSPSPTSGNDLLTVFGNLTMTGTNSFRLSVTDHLNVGDVYTLVNWFGTGTGIDSNSIVIVPPTFGYEFILIDPATTPGEIRVQVTLAIGFDSWLGNHPINPDVWDNGTTVNWLKAGVNTVFTNGDFAHFSDFIAGFVGSSTNVNMVEQLTTAGVIFSNSTAAPFNLIGPGGLSGGGLVLEGEGIVTLANSGTNLWTGGGLIDFNSAVFFNPAVLMVGNGGLNGNLGSGTLTNRGRLVFNRTGSLEVSNNIIGTGSLTNWGTGIVTLSGVNTFTGQVDIAFGTLRAGSTSTGTGNGPLGSADGITVVSNGATLDMNMQNLGVERVWAGGAGVDGLGALVNNGTNSANAALQHVTLTTNLTIGGISRWDVRTGLAQLHTHPTNSNYKITKVGTNQFSFVGITDVDSNLGDVDIQAGTFAIQTATEQFGNPTNTITVFSNANLNVWNLTAAPLNKRIVLRDGGSFWLENGTVTNLGPVTLQGSNSFNAQGTRLTLQSNSLSGAGSLFKVGNGTLELAGTNTYTGNTTISNGTLALIGDSSLATSPIISLGNSNNAAIDVSGRTDGTLTIASARTLRGQGAIRGSLTVASGGTLNVGGPVGLLSVTNAVSLAGTTLMDIDGTTVTSDTVTNATSITYGGTLTVANVGATPAAGQTYRLFSAGSYSGSFTSVTLPALNGSDYWTNNLAVDGTITVVAGIKPNPLITSVEIIGGNLVIRGTNNNGATPGTVYILCSSNLLLPLSNWTVLATNAFDGAGNLNYTNGVAGEPQQFYMLQVP